MKALQFHNHLGRIVAARILAMFHKGGTTGPFAPIRLEEIPEPEIRGDRWVVFRPSLTGVCGSDTKQVLLKGSFDNPLTALISFPHVLGHEAAGIVEHVGPAVTRLAPGDRVVLNPWLSCEPRGIDPVCASCQEGNLSLCMNFDGGGLPPALHLGNCSALAGAYAPKVAAHESQLFSLPEAVSFEQAVLADPFSVSFHAVLKDPPAPEAPTVLIYGAGVIGLAAIPIVRLVRPRARILVVARYPHQVEVARSLGAEHVLMTRRSAEIIDAVAQITGARKLQPWHGLPMLNGGLDAIYDTVCSPETFEIGVRILRSRGILSVIGIESPKRFEWTPIYFKELRIAGSNAFGQETFRETRRHAMEHYLELTARGDIDLRSLVTHRFPLSAWREAFAATMNKGTTKALKVVIEHEPSTAGE